MAYFKQIATYKKKKRMFSMRQSELDGLFLLTVRVGCFKAEYNFCNNFVVVVFFLINFDHAVLCCYKNMARKSQ